MGVLFKTALVGGFQKEEVIEYIEKLWHKAFHG